MLWDLRTFFSVKDWAMLQQSRILSRLYEVYDILLKNTIFMVMMVNYGTLPADNLEKPLQSSYDLGIFAVLRQQNTMLKSAR